MRGCEYELSTVPGTQAALGRHVKWLPLLWKITALLHLTPPILGYLLQLDGVT